MVVPDRPQRTIWRIRFACLITKVTDTHSEYVIMFLQGNNGYAAITGVNGFLPALSVFLDLSGRNSV